LFGARPRHRGIENICSSVALMRQNQMFDVRFVSPNAFSYGSSDGHALNLPALRELLAGMRRAIGAQGRLFFGTFPSEVRPEHVTEETVALIREFAHNDNLVIGAQSGSPRLLDACRRGHAVEDAVRAVKFTLKAGLKANVDFIMGLPGETDEDAAQSIELIRSLARMGARIHAHAFIPLPQSGFANQAPSPVSKHWLGLLRQLTPVGGVYGQWQSQLKLAHKL
jgi:B12-binding domain/radical SAM domain protein